MLAKFSVVRSEGGTLKDYLSPEYRALMNAVLLNDLGTVKQLLADGVSPNDHDKGIESALIFAADEGLVEIVGELLSAGAEVNYEDETGKTPLICGASMSSREIILLCVEHGADIHHQNRHGRNALDYVRDLADEHIVRLLESLSEATEEPA